MNKYKYKVGDRIVVKFPNNHSEWKGIVKEHILKSVSLDKVDRYLIVIDEQIIISSSNKVREYLSNKIHYTVEEKYLYYEPVWYRENRLKGLLG